MAVVGLTLLMYGLYKHRVFSPPPVLRFGERLLPVQVSGQEAETLTLEEGSWYLLISGNHGDLRLAEYLSRLLDEAAMEASFFRPLVVLDGEHETLKEFEVRNFLAFPLHSLHSFRHEDLLDLGLRGHERVYALISPDLEVVFSSSYLQPNDLRLLLEKHIGVQRLRAARPLEIGDPFPAVQASQVAGEIRDLSDRQGSRTWIIFTSQCVACSLEYQMGLFATEKKLLRAWSAAQGSELTAIFSEAFEETILVERLDYLGLTHVPVYLAESPIHGFEDPYLRRSLHGDDVLVAMVDVQGKVAGIQGLTALLRSLESAGSTEGERR